MEVWLREVCKGIDLDQDVVKRTSWMHVFSWLLLGFVGRKRRDFSVENFDKEKELWEKVTP